MKRILLPFLLLLTLQSGFGQVDENGNPILNSVELERAEYDGFSLVCAYYTIENNIDNPESSAFLGDNPVITDYLEFARSVPSNFFVVLKGEYMFALVIPVQVNEGRQTKFTYTLINPSTDKSADYPCTVRGEITEKRVEELQKLGIDSTAKIIDMPYGKAYLFNGIAYSIQPYDLVKAEVAEIVEDLVSAVEKSTDPIGYIERETIGGRLDYTEFLKNKEEKRFKCGERIYELEDAKLFMWVQSVKLMGIDSDKAVIKLWEKIHQRKLSKSEVKVIKYGLRAELKK
ncbi:MAG: hypothetical protein AAF740_13670 [Bacteroidota bacterium]